MFPKNALADPATMQQLHWHGDPDWAFGGGMFHIQCDCRLMIDNLMDLTHVDTGGVQSRKLLDKMIALEQAANDQLTPCCSRARSACLQLDL